MTWVDQEFIYRVNDHDLKIYKIPLNEFDSNLSDYDTVLHSIQHDWITPARNTCMYCEAEFDSRNKLFQHLGFMNVNIKKQKKYKSVLKKRKYSSISMDDFASELACLVI